MPAVAVFGVAEPRRTDLAERIRRLGYNTVIWRNPASLEEGLTAHPVLAFVGLNHPTAEDAVRRLAAAGIRVIALGDSVTDLTEAAMMALGAEGAVESDRVIHRLDGLLPRLT